MRSKIEAFARRDPFVFVMLCLSAALATLLVLTYLMDGAFAVARHFLTPDTQTTPVVYVADTFAMSGCGNASPVRAGTSAQETIQIDGATRDYLLHVPSHYKDTRAIPLVFAFHGHGETDTQFQTMTGLSARSNISDFLLVYPQGARGGDGQTGWNTGRTNGPYIDPTTDDVAFVRAILAHVEATFCVNASRIYATGFSNGGGFVNVLACSTDIFSAVAIVSGDYVDVPCAHARPVPLLEIHGTNDTINPYDGNPSQGKASVATFLAGWVARNACNPTPKIVRISRTITRETWTGCARGVTIVHYRVAGAGHTWIRVRRFNATQTIWTFFTAH